MTFLTVVVKMGHSEDKLFAVLNESKQDRKRRQILAKVTETVAAYRLREMKDLQVREKLATWRRMNGFDRVADGEDNWSHGPRSLPPTPEEFTASLWSEVNALKDAISMPARDRPWQKTMEFVDGLKGVLPDKELTAIKRYVERRSREAAQVTVTPVSTVQHCVPRSPNPEMPPDVCVSLESNEGKVGSERDELESPSAGRGFETPGQQCHPMWKTGRTTADGFQTAGVGSNLGKHTSPTTECAGARAGTPKLRQHLQTSLQRNTLIREPGQLRHRQKSGTRPTSEENRQFDPGGKGEKAPPWNAAVILSLFFLGGALGYGRRIVFASCFLSLCACLSALFFVFIYCSFQVITFQRAEKYERRRGSSR